MYDMLKSCYENKKIVGLKITIMQERWQLFAANQYLVAKWHSLLNKNMLFEDTREHVKDATEPAASCRLE